MCLTLRGQSPYPYTLDCALSWIVHHIHNFDADKSYEFAVCDRQTGTVYGAIALTNHQRYDNGEIAYWIGEEYWGKGNATDIAGMVCHQHNKWEVLVC
ncbi:GNAT family N-acetyltransferase [Paenibacillus glucanolyticus]|uniref:GNAT family N-acetyltransferase n=1 Tax=Paenibacillus glucanolyticus TaxID=59843 RepID=UPI0030EECE60